MLPLSMHLSLCCTGYDSHGPPTSKWGAPPGSATTSGMPLASPLLGNGDLGVALLGDSNAAAYHIGLNQFWAIRAYNYTDKTPEPPYPRVEGVGKLVICSSALSSSSYEAEMDTRRAEVRTVFKRDTASGCGNQRLRTVAFEAPDENALFLQLSLDAAPAAAPRACDAMDITASLSTIDSNRLAPAASGCVSAEGVARRVCSNTTATAGWASRLAVTNSTYPISVGIAMRVEGGQGELRFSAAAAEVNATVVLSAGKTITIVLQVRTNRDVPMNATNVDENDESTVAVNKALVALPTVRTAAAFCASRHAANIQFWERFWNRSSVSLPQDSLLERFWFGSQYLLGSASRRGKVPPGLWGPWVTGDTAKWHGDYTLNYNYEATFFGAGSSNHLDEASAQFEPLLAQAKRGRKDAAYYNCSGLHFSGHIAAFGFHGSLGPAPFGDMRQHSDASFAALNFLSWWEYSRNVTWMRRTAFPFVAEVAEWWECWLKLDNYSEFARATPNKYRWIDPSDCNNEGCGSHNPSALNPIISIVFIRRIFTVLCEMADVLGGAGTPGVPSAARLARWSDIANNIAMPQTAPLNGSQQVWTYSEVANDPAVPAAGQNSINLYPIFPSEIVSLSSPAELLATGVSSVLQSGAFGQGNSFPTIFTAGVRVNATGIVNNLKIQLEKRMGLNYVVSEAGGGVEVFGATEAVNSMLLTSHEGVLRFFPVLPNFNAPASFRSLRAKGAFLVDAAWDPLDQRVHGVRVKSEVGGVCNIYTPWPSKSVHVVDGGTGKTIAITWTDHRNIFRFSTRGGATYTLEDSS